MNRIAIFLRQNGLRQVDLARFLGVSEPSVSRMAKGLNNPSEENLRKILSNDRGWDVSMLLDPEYSGETKMSRRRIPLYDEAVTIGGKNGVVAEVGAPARPREYIDAGDWFPNATAAMYHYGDSMVEYPSGCILALKRVQDSRLIINGEHYVIETDEFRITKQVQDDGGDYIMAYSSNRETYPDGHLVHSPIRIPKDAIRHLDLVLGCVVKRFSNAPISVK